MNRRSFFRRTVGALVAGVVARVPGVFDAPAFQWKTIAGTTYFREPPNPNLGQIVADAWERAVLARPARSDAWMFAALSRDAEIDSGPIEIPLSYE